MYFAFRDQVFRQREGLPMVSVFQEYWAIILMEKLETIALSSDLMISPYKRYFLTTFISKQLMKKQQMTSII